MLGNHAAGKDRSHQRLLGKGCRRHQAAQGLPICAAGKLRGMDQEILKACKIRGGLLLRDGHVVGAVLVGAEDRSSEIIDLLLREELEFLLLGRRGRRGAELLLEGAGALTEVAVTSLLEAGLLHRVV